MDSTNPPQSVVFNPSYTTGSLTHPHKSTIDSKAEMYELYHAGAFGNMLKAWPTLSDFYDDYRFGRWPEFQAVALRLSSKPGIEPLHYCQSILPKEVETLVNIWHDDGINTRLITVNEIGPDYAILLQGEIMRSERYYDLRFSEVKKVMRLALAESQIHKGGMAAMLTMRERMDTPSYENLQRLFDLWPDSVIEFSTYSKPVGTLQLNTVFWEVRNY